MAKRKRLNPTPAEAKSAAPDVSHAKRPALPPAMPPGAAPVARVAQDAAATAAIEEMATVLGDARREGRLIVPVRLDQVELRNLERDRLMPEDIAGDDDMAALIESLRTRGQQVPIDVVRIVGDPRERYGLISGLRRLTALRHLWAQTREARFQRVNVRIIRPEGMRDAYRAMVEENEIRAGLSFYERARVVVKAVEKGVFETVSDALRGLYGALPRARRSKIGSFVPVVQALDGVLRHPTALSEKRGLALSRALVADADLAARLTEALRAPAATPEAEQAIIAATIATPSRPRPPVAQKQSLTLGNLSDGHRDLAIDLRDGHLALTGSAVDEDFARALLDWAAGRGFAPR